MAFVLRNNLAGPGFALTLALSAALPPSETKPVAFTDIYYSFTDDPGMTPLYLGRGNSGETFQSPFNPQGREVRFYFNPAPADSEVVFTDFSKMAQSVFTPSSAYTVTNATTDRTFDANATTIHELADVVATIIEDTKI
jgi:hypothetical protein